MPGEFPILIYFDLSQNFSIFTEKFSADDGFM